ncbi:hypothetical protein FRX31_003132 [Thalictrum thalictroides]|uniref:DUF4283 domain-containing protein n=1 Tax=Thalictrum thalictroides TaxID=46969 RepID=A0A7J6XFU1_THATH|nr:hypothetical protein FRX31_003132 [Thalictrum thalictroides]
MGVSLHSTSSKNEELSSSSFNSKLNLSDSEVADFKEELSQLDKEKWERTILGKLLLTSPKHLDSNYILKQLSMQWKPKAGIKISTAAISIYRFEFTDYNDMEFVINKGPWLLDGHVVSFKKWEEDVPLRKMSFHVVSFWVQIHRLPLERVTCSVGIELGSKIGDVKEVDEKEHFDQEGPFLRIRIAVNTNKRLRSSLKMNGKNDSVLRLLLIYERLGIYCVNCRKIGHDRSECKEEYQEETSKSCSKSSSSFPSERSVSSSSQISITSRSLRAISPTLEVTSLAQNKAHDRDRVDDLAHINLGEEIEELIGGDVGDIELTDVAGDGCGAGKSDDEDFENGAEVENENQSVPLDENTVVSSNEDLDNVAVDNGDDEINGSDESQRSEDEGSHQETEGGNGEAKQYMQPFNPLRDDLKAIRDSENKFRCDDVEDKYGEDVPDSPEQEDSEGGMDYDEVQATLQSYNEGNQFNHGVEMDGQIVPFMAYIQQEEHNARLQTDMEEGSPTIEVIIFDYELSF